MYCTFCAAGAYTVSGGGKSVECYPFVNLPLGYGFDALEPYIDGETMRVHYEGHLQGYVDTLNARLARCPELQRLPLCALAENRAAPAAVRRAAGGVLNHRLYFACMNPNPCEADRARAAEISRQFGGADGFWRELKAAAMSVFGSGYAFLVRRNGRLCIVTTANQALPPGEPLLCVDVWEHAYYLKHQNRRAEYLDAWREVVRRRLT